MNNEARIMITTSARVAANMTAQGFNVKCRNFSTGRFIPFEILPISMETTGIFSIDETNQTIVERKKKALSIKNGYDVFWNYAKDLRDGSIVSENHVVYDAKVEYKRDGPFYNLNDWKFQCEKRNLTWRNVCYEIYG